MKNDSPENYFTSSNPLGVRQGGNESPTLFNYYIDYALRVFEFECEQKHLETLDIPFFFFWKTLQKERKFPFKFQSQPQIEPNA